MSDDKKKKRPCPDSIVAVGAASVYLRHALGDGIASTADFDAVESAVEACLPDLQKLGIAHMEIAAGLLDLMDAKEEFAIRSAARARLLVMRGHNSWKMMLDRHDIANPTDDQIKVVHGKSAGAQARVSETMNKLVALGNWR